MVRVGVVWDRTVAFVGERFGALLPIALATMVLPEALSGVLALVRGGAPAGARALLGVAALVLALVSLWGRLAVTLLAIEPGARPADALRHGARRLPAMVGIALLLLAIVAVVSGPLVYLIVAAGVSSMDMDAMRVVLTGAQRNRIAIGLLVAFVVSLWIGARLLVLMPVVAAERRGLRAIPRAWALTRGLGLRLAGVLLLYGAVVGVVTYAAQTVFGTVLLLMAGGGRPVGVAAVLTALTVACVSAVFTVFATVFLAQLYRALRGAGEGVPAA